MVEYEIKVPNQDLVHYYTSGQSAFFLKKKKEKSLI